MRTLGTPPGCISCSDPGVGACTNYVNVTLGINFNTTDVVRKEQYIMWDGRGIFVLTKLLVRLSQYLELTTQVLILSSAS